MDSDLIELLKFFNAYQVEYLVVGGYAVAVHAEPRYTKDLDIWVRASQSNAKPVFQALKSFGAPLMGLTEDDFAQEGYFYQIGIAPVRVDILLSIKGVKFEEAWARRVETEVAGVKATVISREDLITAKLAAGRPQDIVDAQILSASKPNS